MAPEAWADVPRVAEAEYSEALGMAHQAVQLLSRAAECAFEHREDGTHAALTWSPALGALVTQPFAYGGKGIQAGLELETLAIVMAVEGAIVSRDHLDSVGFDEAGQNLVHEIESFGVTGAGFFDPLSYELESHPVAEGAPFQCTGLEKGLQALAAWYGNAARAIPAVLAPFRDFSPSPGPVRVWPHHFDMASLFLLKDGNPEKVPSINVGFSPGDDAIPEPYFYVTPYPTPRRLAAFPGPGGWHRDGFTAAVLAAAQIHAAPSQEGAVYRFLERALNAAWKSLEP